jgi:hypothetical protein
MRFGLAATVLIALVGSVDAQPVLRLKSGHVPPNLINSQTGPARGVLKMAARGSNGYSHLILQFAAHPGPSVHTAAESAGLKVLSYVPDNGLLVSVPGMVSLQGLDVIGIHILSEADKLSRDLVAAAKSAERLTAVVEMHPDIARDDAARLLAESGLESIENPDLLPHQWLARGGFDQLQSLAARDEVAYLYPASQELASRTPVLACLGGGVDGLPVAASLVSAFGEGWDGPGLGGAILGFHIGAVTTAVADGAVHSEAARAMSEWASAARLRFRSASAGQSNTIEIHFFSGEHGDGFAFDGSGKTLAHTFYPPPNPETQAGDMHLDLDEPWKIGADIDVYSVLLHEMGHALGLGHSDDPRAVMYPFYRRYSALHPVDVLGIQQIYATPEPGFGDNPPTEPPTPPAAPAEPPTTPATPTVPAQPPPAPPAGPPAKPPVTTDTSPPSLAIYTPTTPSLTTTAQTIRVSGVAQDSAGAVTVTWTNSAGGAGTAAGAPGFAANVPLAIGLNRITVTAEDTAGNKTWRLLNITRR